MFEQIAKTVLQISLLSVAAILLVMILRAVFGTKLKTRLVCALWMLVLMRLILPVTLNSPVHLGNALGFIESTFESAAEQETMHVVHNTEVNGNDTAAYDVMPEDEPADIAAAENTGTGSTAKHPDTAVLESAEQKAAQVNPWQVVLAVWIAGTVMFLVVNVFRMLVFRKKTQQGKTLNTPMMQRLVDSNKLKLGIKKDICVMECRYINVPAVMGFRKPVILLPAGLSDTLDAGKLDKIILHEMCHIKRKDLLKNFVWLIARALHWFNPLVWIAYKAYLDDVESACDETALRYLSGEGVCEYSQALVDVMKFLKNGSGAPVLISFCKDKSKIRKRVMNMVKPQKKARVVSIAAVLIMAVIVFGCFTTACTSAEEQTADAEPTPEAVVQPSDTADAEADEEDTTDEKPIPEKIPAIPEEQSGISEEVLQELRSYAINDEQTFVLDQSEDYYGDRIMFFYGDMTSYRLFESDLSLRSLSTKAIDCNLPIEITEEEAKTIIIEYANKFWPDLEVEITAVFNANDDFKLIKIEGILKNAGQSEQQFYGEINGKGELISIGRVQIIDIEQCIADGNALSMEQAKEQAYQYLCDYAHLNTNIENIKTVSEMLDDSHELYYDPQYIFEFEYRSDNPTIDDYDYDAYVVINPATGDFSGMNIEPILENINVISMEEAEQIAKEYIVSTTSVQNIDEITTTYKSVDADGEIAYSFCFDYEEGNGCSITIMAATGEIGGVGY